MAPTPTDPETASGPDSERGTDSAADTRSAPGTDSAAAADPAASSAAAGDAATDAEAPAPPVAPVPPEPPLPPDFPVGPDQPGAAGAGDGASASTPAADAGFFGWLRSLGVPRTPGWIGGVAAGIANRLGIDPLIVRGVLVVFALFGAPAFLAYGAAWLLLPNASGRIHLEQLLRGVWDSALIGIAIFLLVGLFPPAFGVPAVFGGAWAWMWGGDAWANAPWFSPFGINLGPVVWTLLLLAGIAALVVWLVRRSRAQGGAGVAAGGAGASAGGSAAAYTPYAPAGRSVGPTGSSAGSSGAVAPAVAISVAGLARGASSAPTVADGAAAPPAPPRPEAGSSAADYEAWKLRYDEWRAAHAEWRRAQSDAGRQARAEIAEQNRARSAAYAAEAEAARRLRRATRPRASFAYVVATLGGAIVVGSLTGIAAFSSPATADWAGTIALAAAALVSALSMVLAGSLRRRSGFLAFTTIVLLVLATIGAVVPRPGTLVVIGSIDGPVREGTFVQAVGDVDVSVDGDDLAGGPAPRMEIVQGAGEVDVQVRDDARLELQVDCGSCWVELVRMPADGIAATYDGVQLTAPGSGSWERVVGQGTTPGETDATIAIRTGAGNIRVVLWDEG
ncbi:PspC domain-containing protein [Agromyces sp. MMS24-JH15]|uniref:PspC domain-containing protein n=1 Tax=Agromyces sp. MMS24-JH15 TaxID=3243765 RepID=UPI00374A4C4E